MFFLISQFGLYFTSVLHTVLYYHICDALNLCGYNIIYHNTVEVTLEDEGEICQKENDKTNQSTRHNLCDVHYSYKESEPKYIRYSGSFSVYDWSSHTAEKLYNQLQHNFQLKILPP